MKLIFFIILIIIGYVYAGYYLILLLLKQFIKMKNIKLNFFPDVTLFIPVYNEEKIIRKKIENILSIDYPREKLEIIIYSDGSSDKTNQIVTEYLNAGIKFVEGEVRRGKNYLINNALELMNGEIIVFSDANSLYKQDAIKNLVQKFHDPEVGCVCGKLVYINDTGSLVGKGESLYFRYESVLKNLESLFGNVVAGNGAIYAIRKNLFSPLPNNVPNDFAHPIEIKAKGFRVLYEPTAIAEERATSSANEEFRRRIRIVLRSFTAFIFYQKKYNILNSSYSFYFVSHKLLRWFVFPLMIIILFVNIILNGPFYRVFLLIQILFYVSALLGFLCQKIDVKVRLFYIPFYFCLINLASFIGIYKYLAGKKEIIWDIAQTTR